MDLQTGDKVYIKHRKDKFKVRGRNKNNPDYIDLVSDYTGGLYTVSEDDIVIKKRGVKSGGKRKGLIASFTPSGKVAEKISAFGEIAILE